MAIPSFPTLQGLTYPVGRTPIWSTLKQDSWSGKTLPIQLWTYPRRRYTLKFDFLRSLGGFVELQTLEGFFNTVAGSANVFTFTDVDDQSVTNALIATGDGVTMTFQLSRSWGGCLEPVFAPRPGFTVTTNGQVNTDWSVGSNPGQIVFPYAPGSGVPVAWTGTYDWLCRFDDDTYDFSKFMNGLWELNKIAFATVKL